MISLRGIERVYPLKGGPFFALQNIALEIAEGDFVSIMGPSGSGKSTLLHVLACTTTRGKVTINSVKFQFIGLIRNNGLRCRKRTWDSSSKAITCWTI
jgi:ABC-type lipoprotein export system ATPase subunit